MTQVRRGSGSESRRKVVLIGLCTLLEVAACGRSAQHGAGHTATSGGTAGRADAAAGSDARAGTDGSDGEAGESPEAGGRAAMGSSGGNVGSQHSGGTAGGAGLASAAGGAPAAGTASGVAGTTAAGGSGMTEIPTDCSSSPGCVALPPGQVTVEMDSACALVGDGTVKCWGGNRHGELGTGQEPPDEFFTAMGPALVKDLTGVQSLAGGDYHVCALSSGGSVSCWGLHRGLSPVPIGDLTDVVMIAAGVTNDCALRQDGTVWCWESNDDRGLSSDEIAVAEPVPVTGITNARFIASGGDHACAVLANGSVQCWGANDCGQLGDGTTTSSPVAVPAEGVRDAVMLALGDCFSCALSSGFQVSCWGDGPKDVQDDVIAIASNGSGPCVEQLGLLPQCSSGDHFAQGIAVSVAGLDLAHLESMAFNSQANGCITVAEDTTRAVWCWGNNSAGQLGAPGSSSGLPVRVLDFP